MLSQDQKHPLSPTDQARYNELIRLRDTIAHEYNILQTCKQRDYSEHALHLTKLRTEFAQLLTQVFQEKQNRER